MYDLKCVSEKRNLLLRTNTTWYGFRFSQTMLMWSMDVSYIRKYIDTFDFNWFNG
jgi:hypothetical protein